MLDRLAPTPHGLQASELLADRFCHLQSAHTTCNFVVPYLPPEAKVVHTPLLMDAWAAALSAHPNQPWVQALVLGLQQGVRIGYHPACRFRRAKENCRSARDHPYIVDDYLASELALKRVAGPFENDLRGSSRFGVIPKSSKPGHWRLIVDLSAPSSASVNDGISTADAGMAYSSIHDAARMVLHLGTGTEMAKIDIASAFRLIPVHPDDRYLLGMKWNNQVFIDQQLPFGLRSAPVLFNGYADALEWLIRASAVSHILHYLDDFLDFDNRLYWAAMCLAFFGFLRCGELTIPDHQPYDQTVHMSIHDISMDGNPPGLSVHIKASKTDPFRLRVTLYLGQKWVDLCPLAVMATTSQSGEPHQAPFSASKMAQAFIDDSW